tara:strand:- start:222 stop:521 length:300 start_codon:yes stop_codon:yes gene_type:complete
MHPKIKSLLSESDISFVTQGLTLWGTLTGQYEDQVQDFRSLLNIPDWDPGVLALNHIIEALANQGVVHCKLVALLTLQQLDTKYKTTSLCAQVKTLSLQ